MGIVTLSVNGREYTVGCGDGEEANLRALGAAVDRRVRTFATSAGKVDKELLLLLTCLRLEDELAETRSSTIASAPPVGDGTTQTPVEALAPDLEALSRRIEAVAGRLKPS